MESASIATDHVAGCYTVGDDAIGSALVRLLFAAKILVEPSAATALAAAARVPGKGPLGIVLSGGNVEPSLVAILVAKYG